MYKTFRDTYTVYRVWRDEASPYGSSWTRTDPRTVDNFRDTAGLPNQNSGRFVAEGRLVDGSNVGETQAVPLHGNTG